MEICHVQINKIMAALDLSHYSESVFSHAATLAKVIHAELVVLHVIDTRGLDYLDEMHVQGLPVTRDEHIASLKTKQSTVIRDEYLQQYRKESVKVLIKVGDPAREIIASAQQEEPSLLVVGPKGDSVVEGFFFGSVAEKVFRHCPCPVLSVRGPEHCQIPYFE